MVAMCYVESYVVRIIGVLKAKLFVLTLNGDKRMKLKESAI